MSKTEPKRIMLTSVNNGMPSNAVNGQLHAVSEAAQSRFGTDFLSGAQALQKPNDTPAVKKSDKQTFRFNLELFKTDSTSYPTFNFSKLVASERKKSKKVKEKQNGFSDPFEENDDDVARIAREMEKKYSNAYSGSGKGRNKKDDFCDIGMGYDESDSFIDNTDAYDEVVPEEIETIEGGFYINCGALEFKSLRPEKPLKTRTDELIKMPNRPKKMVISSSSESDESDTSEDDEDDEDNSDDSEDEESNDNSSVKSTKSKDSGSARSEKGQRSCSSTTSTVKSLKKTKKLEQKTRTINSSSNSPRPDSDVEIVNKNNPIKTITVKDMLKAKRDKFLKSQTGDGGETTKTITIESKTNSNKTSENEASNQESSEEEQSDPNNSDDEDETPQDKNSKQNQASTAQQKEPLEKLRSSDTKLPELDSDVKMNIHKFRESVKASNLIGKKFQLTDSLKDLFFKIDEALMCVDKPQRNMVFAHLEFHLSLPKYFFLRKAKQLRIKEEKQKTANAVEKLSKAINEIMPQAINNYVNLKQAMSGAGDSEQLTVTPKKKFPWNNNARVLLYEAYHLRWTSYPILSTKNQKFEDFVSGFLKTKILSLWPTGWMTLEELQKEIDKQKSIIKKLKASEKQKANGPNKEASPARNLATTTSTATTSYKTSNPNFTAIKEDADKKSYQYNIALAVAQAAAAVAAQASAASADLSNKQSLKRKSNDIPQKPVKMKAPKLSNPPVQQQQPQQPLNKKLVDQNFSSVKRPNTPADVALDLVSPSKKIEASISVVPTASLMYNPKVSQSSSALTSSNSSNTNVNLMLPKILGEPRSQNTAATSAPTYIIDLENYTNTSEILKTTKKLAASRVASSINSMQKQRENESDDNDGVEFVGIIPGNPMSSSSKSSANPNKPKAKKPSVSNASRAGANNMINPFSAFTSEMANIQTTKNMNQMFQALQQLGTLNRTLANQHQGSLSVNPLQHLAAPSSSSSNKQKPSQ